MTAKIVNDDDVEMLDWEDMKACEAELRAIGNPNHPNHRAYCAGCSTCDTRDLTEPNERA